MTAPTRVLILGGGFGGLYAALEFEKALARGAALEVTVINQDNFFLFTPMLHEIAAGDVELTAIVNPMRKLLRRVQYITGEIARVDLAARQVSVLHGLDGHRHDLAYDHVILAMGSVTNFFGLPGMAENALTMKTLGDAITLRNRVIAHLEEADTECAAAFRAPLLTFVIAGGGFAGVETVAAVNDYVREALRAYGHLREDMVRVVLVHPGEVILPELSPALGRYAQGKLAQRGVEMRLNTRVTSYVDGLVALSDGSALAAGTVVWTAGTAPHPLLSELPCPKERGRLQVNAFLQVEGQPGVWALGDCASVPDHRGGFCPPTAQHAVREGTTLARNVLATVQGRPRTPFRFTTLGQLATIGRRTGVAQMFGWRFSGFLAWWMWRTIYLSKLPRFERKVRVALDWTLDLFFSKDLVHIPTGRAMSTLRPALAQAALRQACDVVRNGKAARPTGKLAGSSV